MKEVLRIFRLRWHWIGLTVLAAAASHEVCIRTIAPQEYAASARVRVEQDPGLHDALPDVVADEAAVESTVLRTAALVLLGEAKIEASGAASRFREELAAYRESRAPVSADAKSRVDSLAARVDKLVSLSRHGQGELAVIARSGDSDEAAIVSWAVAETLGLDLEQRIERRVEAGVEELRIREARLTEELDEVNSLRLENSKKFGVADIVRREELLRRLLVEVDEEIHEAEALRLELSHVIDRSDLNRALGRDVPVAAPASPVAKSGEPVEEAGLDREALEEKLSSARLEYELLVARLSAEHPRSVELRERIWRLETLLSKAARVRAVSVGSVKESPAASELIEEYRLLGARLEALGSRRRHLFDSLLEIQLIRPRIETVDQRAAAIQRELAEVREALEARGALGGRRGLRRARVSVDAPSRAAVTSAPGSGPGWRLAVLGAAFLIGFALAGLLNFLDSNLYDAGDVKLVLDLPLIVALPRATRGQRRTLPQLMQGATFDRMTAAATIVHSVGRELDMKVFSVVAPRAGDGTTFTATQLAIALARKGFRTTIVDGDLRHPSLHGLLGFSNELGLTTILTEDPGTQELVDIDLFGGDESVEPESVQVLDYVQDTAVENLFVLAAGPAVVEPATAVESPRFTRAIAELREVMDYVIVDTPGVLEAGEALTLVSLSDGCLFVVSAGRTETGDAVWAKQLFENVHASVLGVVLNKASKSATRSGSARIDHLQPRVLEQT